MIEAAMGDVKVLLGMGVLSFIGGEVLKSTGHQRLGWALEMIVFGLGLVIGIKWLQRGFDMIEDAIFRLG